MGRTIAMSWSHLHRTDEELKTCHLRGKPKVTQAIIGKDGREHPGLRLKLGILSKRFLVDPLMSFN